MGTSAVSLAYPRRPEIWNGEVLYRNMDHFIDVEVVELIAHDQRCYAQHVGKGFCGYVYACSDEEFALRWYEEVWVARELMQVYRSTNLEKMILRVCDDYGDA